MPSRSSTADAGPAASAPGRGHLEEPLRQRARRIVEEAVFDHPERFDVLRDPNPHLGFGGQGAPHCLGANLARLEIDLMFNAIADVLPDITKVGDPRRLRSGWLNGIKEVQIKYT